MDEFVKKVMIDKSTVGTTDIMDWADEHPDARFYFTHFLSTTNIFYGCVVSEYEPDELFLECEEDGLHEWWDLYNGWQRLHEIVGLWICRKNGRYIMITD